MPDREVTEHTLLKSSRYLPHWQEGRATYFVTFRSAIGTLPPAGLKALEQAIRRGEGEFFFLHLAVLMPDHAHLILDPLEGDKDRFHDLSRIMRGIKGTSARSINQILNRTGKVWQAESYDRIIRNNREYIKTREYIALNPVRAGLCGFEEDYEFLLDPAKGYEG